MTAISCGGSPEQSVLVELRERQSTDGYLLGNLRANSLPESAYVTLFNWDRTDNRRDVRFTEPLFGGWFARDGRTILAPNGLHDLKGLSLIHI